MVGLAYPAECDGEVSAWLLGNGAAFGEYADGGVGRLETIRRSARVVDSAQLHAAGARRARQREDVLASTHLAVQRTA